MSEIKKDEEKFTLKELGCCSICWIIIVGFFSINIASVPEFFLYPFVIPIFLIFGVGFVCVCILSSILSSKEDRSKMKTKSDKCDKCGKKGNLVLVDYNDEKLHQNSNWATKDTIIKCTGYGLRPSCGATFCLKCAKEGYSGFSCPKCNAHQQIPRDTEIAGKIY